MPIGNTLIPRFFDTYRTLNKFTTAIDADAAIANLPASIEQGRANRGAAAALKSRVLLFCASDLVNGGYEASNPLVSFTSGSQAARWAAARDAAKAVMDMHGVLGHGSHI